MDTTFAPEETLISSPATAPADADFLVDLLRFSPASTFAETRALAATLGTVVDDWGFLHAVSIALTNGGECGPVAAMCALDADGVVADVDGAVCTDVRNVAGRAGSPLDVLMVEIDFREADGTLTSVFVTFTAQSARMSMYFGSGKHFGLQGLSDSGYPYPRGYDHVRAAVDSVVAQVYASDYWMSIRALDACAREIFA